MSDNRDPVSDLELRLLQLTGVVNMNDQRVSQTVINMQEDISEIKEREKGWVRKESFAFYERAFWVFAGAATSTIIGSIVAVLSSRSGS